MGPAHVRLMQDPTSRTYLRVRPACKIFSFGTSHWLTGLLFTKCPEIRAEREKERDRETGRKADVEAYRERESDLKHPVEVAIEYGAPKHLNFQFLSSSSSFLLHVLHVLKLFFFLFLNVFFFLFSNLFFL